MKKQIIKLVNESDKHEGAFLGGFTYTQNEICECGHGGWYHHNGGSFKCTYQACNCRKFKSSVKEAKVKTKIKHGSTKKKSKRRNK